MADTIEYNYKGDTWNLSIYPVAPTPSIYNDGTETLYSDFDISNIDFIDISATGGYAYISSNVDIGRDISVGNSIRCSIWLINSRTNDSFLAKRINGYGYGKINNVLGRNTTESGSYTITQDDKNNYDTVRIEYIIIKNPSNVNSLSMNASQFQSKTLKQSGSATIHILDSNIPVTFNSFELTEIKFNNSNVNSLRYNGQIIY